MTGDPQIELVENPDQFKKVTLVTPVSDAHQVKHLKSAGVADMFCEEHEVRYFDEFIF